MNTSGFSIMLASHLHLIQVRLTGSNMFLTIIKGVNMSMHIA